MIFRRILLAAVLAWTSLGSAFAGPLIIDAFRVRGPSGANDEYISVFNTTLVDHTVAPTGGTGYAVAASDGVTRCTIPTGTVIPAHGHFLCTNSMAYSLSGYAAGDVTYTTDIPDNAGIAIFDNNVGGASFSVATRMDAVGSTSEANVLYKEGTGYPALTPFSIDYSWVRDQCGKQGSITTLGACPNGGTPVDTNNNTADFYFVDTNGTSAGGGQRLGAPGPQNLSGPTHASATVDNALLDDCVAFDAPPNRVRDFTSIPAQNSTFGTLDIRRTFTNNTGASLTRLRFRIIDLTTFPAPSGFSDLRPITSTSAVVTVDRTPCGAGTSNVTVVGTTLEQPPSQPNGGGFYSTMSVGAVTLGTPLPNGGTIDVRFVLGIQQTGIYKFAIVPEALPEGGGPVFYQEGCTDGLCGANLAITKTDGVTTAAPGGSVTYTITASNAGPFPAVGATVADTFPASLTATWTCVGAAGGTCTASGSGNINDTVNLPVGGSVTYTATAAVSASATGTLTNTATVTVPAGLSDPVPGNNSATDTDTLTPSADLAITKTDSVASVTAGSGVTYTIVASNAGPSNVTGATVADTFPASLTATWTCVGAGGGTCPASGSGNINSLVNLPSGGSVTFTVSATLSVAAVGVLSNTATVTAPGGVTDPNPANNSATDTDTINPPATVTTYTAPSATGSGNVTASFTGGGPACTYTTSSNVLAPPVVPGEAPHGLFTFTASTCVVGSTLNFTMTYPSVLPPGTRMYKYGPTLSNPAPHYYQIAATIVGNVATFSITDGGIGDSDLVANGTITDPVGPIIPLLPAGANVPTMSEWSLILMLLLMGVTGVMVIRRR